MCNKGWRYGYFLLVYPLKNTLKVIDIDTYIDIYMKLS